MTFLSLYVPKCEVSDMGVLKKSGCDQFMDLIPGV